MSTLSVPLDDKLLKGIEDLVSDGVAPNKAALVRKALDKYIEDQIVERILRAEKEPTLRGNLRDLAKKFK
jgi:Arc/MetJ-type ribon-helix-helix transcriptional regulator